MKQFTAAVFIGSIALLTNTIFGESESWTPDENCLIATLPNFVNIGECTKEYSDLCGSDNDGAASLVFQILKCFITGMLDIDPRTQAYLLGEFLKEVLQEADPVTSILEDLCSSLQSSGSSTGCGIFDLDEQALCEDKFELKVPSTLNVSQCLGGVPITCIGDEVITEPLLKGVTEFVACLVKSTLTLGVKGTITELACYITNIPELLFGSDETNNFGLTDQLIRDVQDSFSIDCSSA